MLKDLSPPKPSFLLASDPLSSQDESCVSLQGIHVCKHEIILSNRAFCTPGPCSLSWTVAGRGRKPSVMYNVKWSHLQLNRGHTWSAVFCARRKTCSTVISLDTTFSMTSKKAKNSSKLEVGFRARPEANYTTPPHFILLISMNHKQLH